MYNPALIRENVAIAYANAGRLDDALLFAQAARRRGVKKATVHEWGHECTNGPCRAGRSLG